MAALGKIRKRGVALVIIIGLGLFAFIAEEAFRSCQATQNQQRQQIGEVLGNKITVQEYNALVDEYQDALRIQNRIESFTEEQLNGIKDEVWNSYVIEQIVADECEKVGLTVTDEEMQNMLKDGTNPMLLSLSWFVNQQTGRFDVTMLTKFLDEYKKNANNPQFAESYQKTYKYWLFVEKQLRTQLLAQKYQVLIQSSLLSNPVSAKMAFDGMNQESDIQLASIAYSSINDNDVKVDDNELKAKYNEEKEMFKQTVETRDIKYVSFQVVASAADRAALQKTMTDAANKLESGATPAEVVRKAQSQIPYTGLAATKRAYPSDIANMLDSLSVGQTSKVFETQYDNTLNVIKLISKSQMPDSIEFRALPVFGATTEEAHKTADSIYNALKAGADFEALAQKYGQPAEKQWLTSMMVENGGRLEESQLNIFKTLFSLNTNESKVVQLGQEYVILQVINRKAFIDKYDVAVIKNPITFSTQTSSDAYNKFSQYVSENQTLADLEKNAAKFGYQVQESRDVQSSDHYVAGIRATNEALNWIFDAKEGQVSQLYECGNNGDNFLVVVLTKIHPVGYRDFDDVKDIVKSEVLRDKKFEQIKAKLDGVKDIAGAKAKGAVIDSVNQITFTAPVFVQATGFSEPALSGAVATVKQGAFSPAVVKGNGGAYLFQVLKKTEREGVKFDDATMEAQLCQRAQQAIFGGRLQGEQPLFIKELYKKSNVVDNRYQIYSKQH